MIRSVQKDSSLHHNHYAPSNLQLEHNYTKRILNIKFMVVLVAQLPSLAAISTHTVTCKFPFCWKYSVLASFKDGAQYIGKSNIQKHVECFLERRARCVSAKMCPAQDNDHPVQQTCRQKLGILVIKTVFCLSNPGQGSIMLV